MCYSGAEVVVSTLLLFAVGVVVGLFIIPTIRRSLK